MILRKASTADIPEIQKIAALTWPHAYSDILSGNQVSYMLQMMYNYNTLHKQMTEEGHTFLLAEDNFQHIGFAGFSPYLGTTWKLHKLYVLPFQQKTGAGKALLAQAESIAMEQGATSILLNVNRQNNAFHFYQRMGYQIESEGDFDIGAGFFMNDYVMKKALP